MEGNRSWVQEQEGNPSIEPAAGLPSKHFLKCPELNLNFKFARLVMELCYLRLHIVDSHRPFLDLLGHFALLPQTALKLQTCVLSDIFNPNHPFP